LFSTRFIDLPFAMQSNVPSDFGERAKSLLAVTEQIDKSKAIAKDVVEAVVQFRNGNVTIDQMHSASSLDIDGISDELGRSFDSIFKFNISQEEIPSPEERALIVSKVLTDVEEKTVEVFLRHEVNEAHTRSAFCRLTPAVQGLVVLIGDMIEQRPTLLENRFWSSQRHGFFVQYLLVVSAGLDRMAP